MGVLSIDPWGDSLAAEPDGDLSARLQLWMRRLGDLAEDVRDDSELAERIGWHPARPAPPVPPVERR